MFYLLIHKELNDLFPRKFIQKSNLDSRNLKSMNVVK